MKGKKEMQFELTNFCEIDKFAIQSYCLMHDIDPNLNLGDISKVNTADMEDFNLLVGGSPCFVAGTKVLTSTGYKNIENMKVGDKVLTHKNRYMPVERVGGELNKEIYSLKVQGFLETECTDYHPFYCKKTKDTEPEKLKLKDIKKGFYVGSHINNENTNIFNLSNEDCWILGRYIADGHVRKTKRKNRINSYQYQCILSIGENKVEEMKQQITERHYSCFRHSPSTYRIVFSSMELVNFIIDNNFGTSALTKRIPKFILDLPVDKLKSFLDGYMAGDGCKIGNIYQAITISKELAMALCLIVEKVYNVGCQIYFEKKNPMHIIEGRTVNQHDYYMIRFRLTQLRHSWFIEDGIVWYPVKAIKYTGRKENVYNIEVAEDHTYTANNMITFNCQDFSSAGKKEGSMYTCNTCGHKYNPLEAHYSKRDTCPNCGSKDIEITRSSLIVQYLRVLREKQPEFAIYENVKNLVNKEFREVFNLFIEEIKEIGYVPYWQVLNSKDYGIPQNRERVIAVFIRKDIDHGFTYPKKINLLTTINDITQNTIPENYYIDEKKSNPLVQELIERGKFSENYVYFQNQIFNLGLLEMHGSNQCRRVYAKCGISPTLDTCQGGNRQVKVLEESKTLFHLYANGKISKLTDIGIPFLFPMITEYRTDTHYRPFCGNLCGTLRTINSGGYKRLIEPMDLPICVASRGRYINDPSSRVPGLPTKQRLEPNENGTINTLTSVQKDNYLLENAILKYERTPYGKQIRKAYEAGLITEKRSNIRTLVPRCDGISNTLTTVQKDNYLLEHFIFLNQFLSMAIKTCYEKIGYIPTYMNLETMNEMICGENDDYLLIIDEEMKEDLMRLCESSGYRVRKLTPRECFRLMGFNDTTYEKARYYTDEEEEKLLNEHKKYKTEMDEYGNERGIKLSDAQAYKQAGNSIVVNVLYYVFEELKKQYLEFDDGIKVCSLFSGIGAPEQALKAVDHEEVLIKLKK